MCVVIYMISIEKIETNAGFPNNLTEEKIIDFLYNHLDKYKDSQQAIKKAITYAFSKEPGKGGFLLTATKDGTLVGVVVVNDTGMGEYIPHHILVYIAVDKTRRGQGIGKKLMKEVKRQCPGDIALHVEYDNPAKRLYERCGFSSKYAEMRYKQET